MGDTFALAIAVEQYHDGKFPPVSFAKNDAAEFSEVLKAIGYRPENIILLADNDATKARIDSALRRVTAQLQPDDKLCVYYAGHGYSEGGVNYLTCYDTVWSDKAATSLPTKEVYEYLSASKSRHVVMFLDCCHAGLASEPDERGLVDDLSEAELKAFFAASEYQVCFSACRAHEKSHPSTKVRHGIWTHCLLRALRGEAPEALVRGQFVTSNSLQNFLNSAVPLALREAYADMRMQTPVAFGGLTNEFMIADVGPALEARRIAAAPNAPHLRRATFSRTQNGRVKSLSGFKKHHRVPDEATDYTNGWIHTIGAEDLAEKMSALCDRLREQFKFKRAEMKVDVSDGAGTVFTPHFTCTMSFSLDPDDTSAVTWRTDLTDVTDPSVLGSDSLAAVFPYGFDRLELHYDKPRNVEKMIDELEATDIEWKELSYPHDASFLTLRGAGWDFDIKVDGACVTFVLDAAGRPDALLEGLKKVQLLLATSVPGALLLP